MTEPGPPQPEVQSPESELDYDVIIVRYDRQRESVVVDIGSVEPYAALTMLHVAVAAVEDEIEPGMVITDILRETDFYDTDDDDDEDEDDDGVSG